MLTEKMESAINEQIKWEFYSAFLYLSMAAYFADLGLPGFATWMEAQYEEEVFHARKMFAYVLESGGKVRLQALDEPQHEWKSPLECFEFSLEHEKHVTERINNLASLAQEEKDHASYIFLQWFVSEQVEEEDSFSDVVGKLKLVGDGGGLFMLDRDLGVRVFTPPVKE